MFLLDWCVACFCSQPLSRTLRVFGICWPDPVAPNQQREEKVWMWMEWGQKASVLRQSAAEQNLTDGFLRPPESVRATALTLRWLCLSLCLRLLISFFHSSSVQAKALNNSILSLCWAKLYFYISCNYSVGYNLVSLKATSAKNLKETSNKRKTR